MTEYICNGCSCTILEEDNLYVIGKVPREYCWDCYNNSQMKIADREYICRGCGNTITYFENVLGISPAIHTYCDRCFSFSSEITKRQPITDRLIRMTKRKR